jgi:CDP-diacylglycerol---glycerol-3-phosphate 3-phosphatidyltransferase
VNLPNVITVGRIIAAPAVALLALMPSWPPRLAAFVVFVLAAVTDYVDGKLARERGLVTDLGRILDPLADKLLLAATLVPLYVMQAPPHDVLSSYTAAGGFLRLAPLPFQTPLGPVPLPFWVVAVVLGRELVMTVFRQAALRRGIVISAIASAKWKTGFQWTWIGAGLFWLSVAVTPLGAVRPIADFVGIVGTGALFGALALSLYSLGLYLSRYGALLFRAREAASSR